MSLSQKAKSNSFFTNSLFIFIIRFFPSLAYLLVTIYYSRNLDTHTYGLYQNFWIQLNVLYTIACFGIHVFIVTYSPQFILRLINSIDRKRYAFYIIWLLLISSIFAALQFRPTQTAFFIPFTYLLVYALSMILEAFLIVVKTFRALSFINMLYGVLFLAIHWFIIKGVFSLHLLFTCLLLIAVIRLFIFAFIAGRLAIEIPNDAAIMETDMNSAKWLWLHLGIYDVLQILSTWVDKFIISLVLTSAISAIYYNGSINIPFLPLILTAVSSATLIQLSGIGKEDETLHIIRLVNQTARVLSCIVFPLFFFLLCYRYELFVVVLTSKYVSAVPIFMMAILVLPLRAYSFSTVLQKKHKGAIINKGALMEIVLACLLMYPLYKWIGLPGVALSFVLTTYMQAGYYLHHAAKALNVSISQLLPFLNWIAKLVIFAIIFITIHYVSVLCFTSRIALFLGCGFTAIVILVSLYAEVKNIRKNVNHAS